MSTVIRQAGSSRLGRPPKRARAALGTCAGLVILAVMLFPLYWMLNASLLRPQDLVSLTPVWFPLHGTLAAHPRPGRVGPDQRRLHRVLGRVPVAGQQVGGLPQSG